MKYFFGLFTALSLIACATSIVSSNKNKTFSGKTQIKNDSIAANDFSKENGLIEVSLQKKWVDSVYNQMTLEDRVGQLFMVAAYSNKNEAHAASIDTLIIKQKIGGVIFFQGGPVRQAQLTNRFQAKSKVPLFVGIDAEWGLAMRLDSTYAFPWNMTLGAVQNMELIEKVGVQMAKHAKRIGVHFNFGPVLDVNTNPLNPIIGNRSFGENPKNVTERALAFMNGLQGEGVYATGKHFPGHGDTEKDSHYTLPKISHSLDRMNDVELYPYKKLIKEGLSSVMVAHIGFPALETREGFPSSISKNIVTDLLQDELNFKGLIFTDALNMKGASNFKSPGDIDLAAFLAGNDILLFPENVPLAVQKITEAYNNGEISDERIEKSVKKILKYKYKIGLDKPSMVDYTNLVSDLNTPEDEALNYELYKNAVTVLKNNNAILPIKNLEKQKIAFVKIGDDSEKEFLETLNKYTEVTVVDHSDLDTLVSQLKEYSTVVVGYHKSNAGAWRKHDFSDQEKIKLKRLAKEKNVIVSVFARPYSLLGIDDFSDVEGLILSYQNHAFAKEVTAQIIFGAIGSKGEIPVSIRNDFPVNTGIKTKSLNRLAFNKPENVGMSSEILSKIDEIANEALSKKVAPGMQILVARKGEVIYQKSFGYHTYDNQMKVQNSDLYDVASLTKIMATLPLIAQDFDQEKIDLDIKLGDMLSVFKNTDKKDITLKEMLTHNSGFAPWIPFYKSTLDSLTKYPSSLIYSNTLSEEFPFQVANNMYIKKGYTDVILNEIAKSKLGPKKYKYSDFSFIILKEFLEKSHGKTLDVLIDQEFFKSLGMNRTLYNPLHKFDLSEIAPSEYDKYFRYQLIQGHVHDMAAAMQGGVAGHAGLFSNAMDVAKMMQMFLQKGTYADKTYFSSKTFNKFNSLYYDIRNNRRGLGFDKPTGDTSGSTCNCVSAESFGHTGFTGTMAWVDPKTETVFVFLSNRTFPDSNAVNLLAKEGVRSRIQEVIANAIID